MTVPPQLDPAAAPALAPPGRPAPPPNAPHSAQRLDIQALRGFAVLVVVLYHVRLGRVRSGYLGVDVFFVISGFLITTLVASGVGRGTFTFREFYTRRAKRLLPAAYVTYLATALAAPFFLTQRELADFGAQVLGALTFSGNVVLWKQTGYFEGAADLKPLLHMWSLAVEEQYYFLLPATLLVTRGRWLPVTALLFAASLLAYLSRAFDPSATFYLLPTRAWELLLGSLGALWILAGRPRAGAADAALRVAFVPALACLAVVPFLTPSARTDGWANLAVCVATLLVILRRSDALNAARPIRWLARIGDVSYSLYLVHWPIVAFVDNAWEFSTDVQPRTVRLAELALSLALAFLLYHTVEDPIRRREIRFTPRLGLGLAAATLLVGAVTPVASSVARRRADFASAVAVNWGLSEACEYTTLFVPKPECRTGPHPDLLVWGDSYAGHLVPGIAKTWDGAGVMQATRSRCGPFLGLASIQTDEPPVGGVRYDAEWAKRCIAFNESVVDYVRRDTALKYVVLSSPFIIQLTNPGFQHVVRAGAGFDVRPSATEAGLAALRRTVDALRALGKRVVIVAPPPSTGQDYSACVERQRTHKVQLGPRTGCEIGVATYHAVRAPVLRFLQAASDSAGVAVIRFDPWLCDDASCKTTLDGVIVYRDAGHLSRHGSEVLAERMRLSQLIHIRAR